MSAEEYGCCGECGGGGIAADGPCWDCRGTGHPHPDDGSCRTSPAERDPQALTDRERIAAAIIDHEQPTRNALTKPQSAEVMVREDPRFFVCAKALALADALIAAGLSARPAATTDTAARGGDNR